MKPLLFFVLFLLCGALADAQSRVLPGQWVGKLTQDEGGYRSTYDFEIYLIERNGRYYGRTYVWTEGVYGEMRFTGRLHGDILHLEESEVIYSRKPASLSWCLKTLQLRLSQSRTGWLLEGPWQGESGFGPCIPGYVVLSRVAPRA